jgi:hypothetical protein
MAKATTSNQLTRTPLAEAVNRAITQPAEFGDFDVTRALFGLPRSTCYELEREGSIRIVRLRKPGNVRGRALVDLGSVRRYLDSCGGNAPGVASGAAEGAK